jgi:hypothetical protein
MKRPACTVACAFVSIETKTSKTKTLQEYEAARGCACAFVSIETKTSETKTL